MRHSLDSITSAALGRSAEVIHCMHTAWRFCTTRNWGCLYSAVRHCFCVRYHGLKLEGAAFGGVPLECVKTCSILCMHALWSFPRSVSVRRSRRTGGHDRIGL